MVSTTAKGRNRDSDNKMVGLNARDNVYAPGDHPREDETPRNQSQSIQEPNHYEGTEWKARRVMSMLSQY